jgi:hypothetical protein
MSLSCVWEKPRQEMAVISDYTDLKNFIFGGELIAINE